MAPPPAWEMSWPQQQQQQMFWPQQQQQQQQGGFGGGGVHGDTAQMMRDYWGGVFEEQRGAQVGAWCGVGGQMMRDCIYYYNLLYIFL